MDAPSAPTGPEMTRPRTALVLSGGGARGAYQIGVLRGLVEHGFLAGGGVSIDVFVGSSAGSINATTLAAWADDLATGIGRLERVWSEIRPSSVYRTDLGSLGRIGLRWAWDLSFGGATRRAQPKALLDTAPLHALLAEHVPFARLEQTLASGRLGALALVATDLQTASGVVFLSAPPGTPTWRRRRWRIEATTIRVEHLLASSAIPIFFPSVEIDGRYFGDGSIRNTAPLSPAINLGADRVIAIGVSGPPVPEEALRPADVPSVAQVAGVLLDAVMLDAIEVDVEHSERVNRSVVRVSGDRPADGFRPVDVLWLRPSQRVRELAAELTDRIPPIVHYLMRGLGSDAAVNELASYLLFDPSFCGALMELGRQDVAAERERIAAFFAR
ncbi:MAG: patatin-like phospholipase family protein [Deltaproteobacteria bacterium]|nr:patatin-like phospholipase family protein [Deltaproteobacteria bacterium]